MEDHLLVRGKRAHDARLAALMQTHGVRHIHTFNVSDFVGFTGIQAVSPAQVTASAVP